MKTPINAERLRNHFAYSWWKYLLGVALLAVGWSLFFSVTATRADPDEKVELYVYGNIMEDYADSLLESMRREAFPDQAEFDCYVLPPDTTSGIQAFTIRVAMGDGDLLVMPQEVYRNYAQEGLLVDLDSDELESLEAVRTAMAEREIAVDPGRDWWSGSDDVRRCYGIPVREVALLSALMADGGTDSYLCMRVNNGNDEVTAQVLARILTDWSEGGATHAIFTPAGQ